MHVHFRETEICMIMNVCTGLTITSSAGPGVNTRPPHQAYKAFSQPSTVSTPLHWDTTSLMQALHAASIQQPSNGDWFMTRAPTPT
jgi:hypothetical protein